MPAKTYGLELRASSPREAAATLAFDTSEGWYEVKLPRTPLTPASRTEFTGEGQRWQMAVDASKPVYVTFPSPVKIDNVLVTHAQAWNDAFGWQDRGEVTCPLVAGTFEMNLPNERWSRPELSVLAEPPGGAPLLNAVARTPLEPASCRNPYVDATRTRRAEPQYPDFAQATNAGGTIAIQVALNTDGSVDDAWIVGSSGNQQLDQAALQAASSSAYSGATEYCHAALGEYLYVVRYDAGSF